jgi:hypothetical protein
MQGNRLDAGTLPTVVCGLATLVLLSHGTHVDDLDQARGWGESCFRGFPGATASGRALGMAGGHGGSWRTRGRGIRGIVLESRGYPETPPVGVLEIA